MSYVIVPQAWPSNRTFFAQLKRLDPGARIVTLFQCQHLHPDVEAAARCPDVAAARDRDRATS